MVFSASQYVRVSEKFVIAIEIYGLCEENTAAIGTQDIQEIIEILHECIQSQSVTTKKKEDSKQKQKSGIVTGTNVRIGYMFKRRPGNQICLVPSSYVIHANDKDEDEDLRSFQVLQEKIIVYAHKLGSSSPNKMSQLVKKVQDKRQSTGSGVSISNYFKKVGSQSSSNSSQTGSSSNKVTDQSQPAQLENQSDGCLDPQAPPSEGRRHKIKSILKRVDEKVRRRRKRRPSKQMEEHQKASLFVLASSDDSSDEETGRLDSTNSMSKDKEIVKNIESSNNAAKVKDYQNGLSVENQINLGGTIDSSNTTADRNDKPVCGSSTQFLDVPVVSGKPADRIMTGDSDSEPKSSREPDNRCILGDMRVSQVSVPELKMVPSDAAGDGTVTVISVDQVHALQEDSIQVSSGSEADDSILPTASFCIKPYPSTADEENNSLESINKMASAGDNSPQDSPKFQRQKSFDQVKNSDDTSSKNEEIIPTKTSNAPSKLTEKVGKLGRFRFKRKFPTFSDSDSDDIVLPAKKISRVKTKIDKFVDKDTSDISNRYYTFSSLSSSENETKKQTKLSFFMNKENVSTETKPENKDLDLELIEELSQTPRVKKETDSILKREIEAVDSVKDLNEDHIGYMVGENEKHLRKIFEGKVKCRRHDMYKQGGNSRRMLNHESRIDHYTDEQVDQVMEILMGMFCKRHHKYLDYVMKVLLPEMLIKLHMDIHGTSHHASDNLLGQTSSQFNSSEDGIL